MTVTQIIILETDGTMRAVQHDQNDLTVLLEGELTFCGAVHEIGAFALCRKHPSPSMLPNPFAKKHVANFDEDVRGPILLIGSDVVGEACDLDRDEATKFFFGTGEESEIFVCEA